MGLFSKLGKALKKTIRGIGKAIKKITKPFRKVLRKVLSPIGRIVNKLGFVGTLALSWMLPGAGAWIGQWLSSFGPGMANLVAKVSTGFTNLMKPFKTVYNSVTEVFKQGANKIGQMFGFEGPAGMKWGGYGEGLVADASVDAVTGAVTGGVTQGTLTDSVSKWVNNIIGPKSKPPVATIEAPIVDVPTVETSSLMDPTTPKGIKVSESLNEQTIIDTSMGDDKSLFSKVGDKFTKGKEYLAKKEIGSTFVSDPNFESPIGTWGQAGKGAQVAASGYGTYMAFAGGGDYDPGFYNPNIDDAQGFLQESAMYAQTPMDELYFSGNRGTPQDTFNSLANNYITGFGQALPQGVDPYTYALQMPGYGYNFNSYIEDSFGGMNG